MISCDLKTTLKDATSLRDTTVWKITTVFFRVYIGTDITCTLNIPLLTNWFYEQVIWYL